MKKKRCFKCRRYKEIRFFYKHKQMGDGYLGKCKSCTRKDVQDRYNNPESRRKISEYEKKRSQDINRKEKVKEYVAKRKNIHRLKYAAHNKLANALRSGKIKREPCEVCGELKVQGHHTDYRKALDVIWLCFKHHRELHGQTVISNYK